MYGDSHTVEREGYSAQKVACSDPLVEDYPRASSTAISMGL